MRTWLGAAESDEHDIQPFDPRDLGAYFATSASFTVRGSSIVNLQQG
jgi:hypothetical protein